MAVTRREARVLPPLLAPSRQHQPAGGRPTTPHSRHLRRPHGRLSLPAQPWKLLPPPAAASCRCRCSWSGRELLTCAAERRVPAATCRLVVLPHATRATTWRLDGHEDADRAPARPVLAAGRQAREGAVPRGDPRRGPAPRRVHPPPRVREHRRGEAEARLRTGPAPARCAVGCHHFGVVGLVVLRDVGEPPGVVRRSAGHGQLRGDHRPRHAVEEVHGGVRHRQRHDVGAVPSVRCLLLPAAGAALHPGQVVHVRQHLLHLLLLRRPRHQRLRRRPLPLRRPVRRRLLHHRLLRRGHPHARPRRRQGVPVRVRREEPRAVRTVGGADGARPRQDVADGAGVRQVRRRVRVLPPGGAVGDDGVPGLRSRRAGGERAAHADADRRRVDILLRGDDGHQGGRAPAAHPGVRVHRRRRAGGLRHGDHAPAAVGVRADAVGVRQGHGRAGVQEGPRLLHPRHLLRPDGVQGEHRAAGGGAGVQGRRVPRRRRVGDPVHRRRVAGVPGVRPQRRRHRRGHHREHAAEDVQRALRPRQEGRRLRARRLLIPSGPPRW